MPFRQHGEVAGEGSFRGFRENFCPRTIPARERQAMWHAQAPPSCSPFPFRCHSYSDVEGCPALGVGLQVQKSKQQSGSLQEPGSVSQRCRPHCGCPATAGALETALRPRPDGGEGGLARWRGPTQLQVDVGSRGASPQGWGRPARLSPPPLLGGWSPAPSPSRPGSGLGDGKGGDRAAPRRHRRRLGRARDAHAP